MTISIDGLDQLTRNLDELEKTLGREVKSAQIAGGAVVEGETKRLIQQRSIGETVTRHRTGGKSYSHIASAPGDAPNTDTGRLVQSIRTEVLPDGVYVGTSVEYAPHLEFGTVIMAPRPFLFPAFQAKRPLITKLITKAVQDSIQSVSS